MSFWPKRIIVVHRIELSSELREWLTDLVRPPLPEPAQEQVPVKAEITPKEERLRDWLAAQAWDANKISHFAALIDVFVGKRPESGQWTRSAAIRAMLDEEAPLGV